MTIRAKSKGRQWALWLGAVFVAFAAYVFVFRILYGDVSWNLFAPRPQRVGLPIFVLFCVFAWETRWDGIVRKEESPAEKKQNKNVGEEVSAPQPVAVAPSPAPALQLPAASVPAAPSVPAALPPVPVFAPEPEPEAEADESGEGLYVRARGIPHQAIPDFEEDAEYLELLGKSAEAGFHRAMAKLGEYAMRRCAWVEAYYWMWLARRNGMSNLSFVMQDIRKNWMMAGFPSEIKNVHDLFSMESGSIGRALLHVDSGYKSAEAKKFLRANYPDLLRKSGEVAPATIS